VFVSNERIKSGNSSCVVRERFGERNVCALLSGLIWDDKSKGQMPGYGHMSY
jgi:hypothetical protein